MYSTSDVKYLISLQRLLIVVEIPEENRNKEEREREEVFKKRKKTLRHIKSRRKSENEGIKKLDQCKGKVHTKPTPGQE